MKNQQYLGLNRDIRRTRKEVLLGEMPLVMPWAQLVALIGVHAPVAKTGRPPFDLETMLPSSTKNKNGERDPEMHQIAKGNHWHFAMKSHIGVDADCGLVRTVIGTAANVNDVTPVHELLNGEEIVVFSDAGYQSATKRAEATGVDWHVAMRAGKRKQQMRTPWGHLTEQAEKLRASKVRAKVEHPFRVIKRQFGQTKLRCRGLPKNTAQFITLFALSNIWTVRKVLMQKAQA